MILGEKSIKRSRLRPLRSREGAWGLEEEDLAVMDDVGNRVLDK